LFEFLRQAANVRTRSRPAGTKKVALGDGSRRIFFGCRLALVAMLQGRPPTISSESNPALVAFRDWLIEEARRT
jgi:hypothetical protein